MANQVSIYIVLDISIDISIANIAKSERKTISLGLLANKTRTLKR